MLDVDISCHIFNEPISVNVFILSRFSPLNTPYFFGHLSGCDCTGMQNMARRFNLLLLRFYEQFSALLWEVVK